MGGNDRDFELWRERAASVDILEVARSFGTPLKRAGSEWVGPCPACGGRDRFAVNPRKQKFNCRGAVGGNVITMVMHASSLSFTQACEALTGEPPPRGAAKPLTAAQKAEIAQRQAESKQKAEVRERKEERLRAWKQQTASEIWAECTPIIGTIAEAYLNWRGIPMPSQGWDDSLGFHPALEYTLDGEPYPKFPALVGKVVNITGDLAAVHQIFLDPKTGKKIDREIQKVTLGSNTGCAVRLGGIGPKIEAGEGLETCLAIRHLTGFKTPVWACLGTSGLANLELPLSVERVRSWPDGDDPIKKVAVTDPISGVISGHRFVPENNPPGLAAARALGNRLALIGVGYVMNQPPRGDYLDAFISLQQQGST